MEKGQRYFSLRVGERQAEVWHSLPYGRLELLKVFKEKYGENLKEFSQVQREITEAPPTLLKKKQVVVEAKGGVKKEVVEAFFGYIAKMLVETKGNIQKAVELILRDLGNGG